MSKFNSHMLMSHRELKESHFTNKFLQIDSKKRKFFASDHFLKK